MYRQTFCNVISTPKQYSVQCHMYRRPMYCTLYIVSGTTSDTCILLDHIRFLVVIWITQVDVLYEKQVELYRVCRAVSDCPCDWTHNGPTARVAVHREEVSGHQARCFLGCQQQRAPPSNSVDNIKMYTNIIGCLGQNYQQVRIYYIWIRNCSAYSKPVTYTRSAG